MTISLERDPEAELSRVMHKILAVVSKHLTLRPSLAATWDDPDGKPRFSLYLYGPDAVARAEESRIDLGIKKELKVSSWKATELTHHETRVASVRAMWHGHRISLVGEESRDPEATVETPRPVTDPEGEGTVELPLPAGAVA